MATLEQHVAALQANVGSTFALGEGGLVRLAPIMPAIAAVAHIHIWDKQWLGRTAIIKDIARYAFDKWKLQRITGFIPSRHRLAVKNAEGIGFRHEGTMRRAVVYTVGEQVGLDDCLVYGLLPDEV